MGVHLAGTLFDRFVPFGLTDVLVPLASHWSPVPVALGVVSLYLLVAVEVTSLLRARMPARAWRAVHWLSFPLFGLVQLHLLLAGTDRTARRPVERGRRRRGRGRAADPPGPGQRGPLREAVA